MLFDSFHIFKSLCINLHQTINQSLRLIGCCCQKLARHLVCEVAGWYVELSLIYWAELGGMSILEWLPHPIVNTVTSFYEYQRLGLFSCKNTKQNLEGTVLNESDGLHLKPTACLPITWQAQCGWQAGHVFVNSSEMGQCPHPGPAQEGHSFKLKPGVCYLWSTSKWTIEIADFYAEWLAIKPGWCTENPINPIWFRTVFARVFLERVVNLAFWLFLCG